MYQTKLVKFLKELKKNNNREWFIAHKDEYEYLRKIFLGITGDLILEIKKFDKGFKITDPKKCLFRIYNDMRFSKDKTPYKTWFSARFADKGNGVSSPGYYFHIGDDGQMILGGGLYMPSPDSLKRIRENIYNKPEEIEEIIYTNELEKSFGGLSMDDSLTRLPRGFPENAAHAELLKLKSFGAWKSFTASKIDEDKLIPLIADHFKTIYPLVDWLRRIA